MEADMNAVLERFDKMEARFGRLEEWFGRLEESVRKGFEAQGKEFGNLAHLVSEAIDRVDRERSGQNA